MNGFGCDYCLLKGEDKDFECECLKPCGEACCEAEDTAPIGVC